MVGRRAGPFSPPMATDAGPVRIGGSRPGPANSGREIPALQPPQSFPSTLHRKGISGLVW